MNKTISNFACLYIVAGDERYDYVAYEHLGGTNYHLISADEFNNRSDLTSKELFESLVKDRDLNELLTASEMNTLLISQMRRPD